MTLLRLYPEQKESLENYRLVYEALKFLHPVEMAVDIILYQYHDDDGQPSAVDVSGINLQPDQSVLTNGLALEFNPWSEWLGMGIDSMTSKTFSEPEIICHCLNEMTFAGFEESDIANDFLKLSLWWMTIWRCRQKKRKRIPSVLMNSKQG